MVGTGELEIRVTRRRREEEKSWSCIWLLLVGEKFKGFSEGHTHTHEDGWKKSFCVANGIENRERGEEGRR